MEFTVNNADTAKQLSDLLGTQIPVGMKLETGFNGDLVGNLEGETLLNDVSLSIPLASGENPIQASQTTCQPPITAPADGSYGVPTLTPQNKKVLVFR